MKFAKLHEAIEIAKRLEDRLNKLANEHEENGDHEWEGSEDYSDAISYIGDLFEEAASEMLAIAYKGADAISVNAVMVQFGRASAEATLARQSLRRDFQLIATIDDI